MGRKSKVCQRGPLNLVVMSHFEIFVHLRIVDCYNWNMGFFIFLAILVFAQAETTLNPSIPVSEVSVVAGAHSEDYCAPPPTRQECQISELTNPRCTGIDFSWTDSPNQVSGKYSVYREPGADRYSVDVPISFYFSDIPGDHRELNRSWTQRVNGCLREYSANLTDGRRKLNISVVDRSVFSGGENYSTMLDRALEKFRRDGDIVAFQDEIDRINGLFESANSGNEVVIHNEYDRADSQNWPEDIDCSTITHEVLHLLGLCDHYQERWSQYTPDSLPFGGLTLQLPDQNLNDCRETYDGPNLMKNHRIYRPNEDFRTNPQARLELEKSVRQGPPPGNERYINNEVTCTCPAGFSDEECRIRQQAAAQPGEWESGLYNCLSSNLEDFERGEPTLSGQRADYSVVSQVGREITIQYPGVDRLNVYNANSDRLRVHRNPAGLDEAQVEAVLHPLCMRNGRVRGYYEATANAYRDRYRGEGCAQ